MEQKIVAWWSGGITSAVACKIAIDLYGLENVRIIFIDTFNESDDTYRFKKDCEEWYEKEIETITAIGKEYKSIKDVWLKYLSLNTAHGAICSSELKRAVRLKWQKENEYDYQVFGFDIDEPKRAKSMAINYPDAKPVFLLLLYALTKKNCLEIIEKGGYKVPETYYKGYKNNNCDKTGCVQGGIGYWQKKQREEIDVFNEMAATEHQLTDLKGEPVTMLKDQSKGGGLVFLKPHPDYPQMKDISMMKGREPEPLFECNGFGCAVNDLQPLNKTVNEINYVQTELF